MNCQVQNVESGGAASVVVCHGDRSVVVWKIAPTEVTKIYSTTLPTMRPVSAHFNEKGQVLVFSQIDGDIALLHETTGNVIWQKKIPDQENIHDVVVDHERDRMVFSTGKDCRVYSLSDTRAQHTLRNDLAAITTFPKRIAFTGDNKFVVAGTDRGEAVLFSVEDGLLKHKFKYPRAGLVQTVAAYSDESHDYVAVAGSTPEWVSDVMLYSKYRSCLLAWPRAPSKTVMVLVTAFVLLGMSLLMEEVEFRSPVSWRHEEISMEPSSSTEAPASSSSSRFRKEWL
ncbi:hypothetical protein V5O48_018358 [Marasmius crinis-equi]|uniref:Uncharacterized protein n=1 Tax=Marasmius crinis-equi TaxID=585013 RepID=A0ABR3ELE0_9AGAR